MNKMTRTQVMELARIGNGKVYAVGYCKLQTILRHQERIGYNFGVYGWNYDVYQVGNDVIITGYRPFNANRIDEKLIDSYEDEAKKLAVSNLSYELKKDNTNNLLKEMFERINGTAIGQSLERYTFSEESLKRINRGR